MWHWKGLFKGYNVSIQTFQIRVHMKKTWTHKITRLITNRIIFQFQCNPHHYFWIIMSGEEWWFPPKLGHGEHVNVFLLWFNPCNILVSICINCRCSWIVQVHLTLNAHLWVCFNPISKLQLAPFHFSCELESV